MKKKVEGKDEEEVMETKKTESENGVGMDDLVCHDKSILHAAAASAESPCDSKTATSSKAESLRPTSVDVTIASSFLTPDNFQRRELDLSTLLDSVSTPGKGGGFCGYLSPIDDHVDFSSLHLICNSETPVSSPANAMLSPALLSSYSSSLSSSTSPSLSSRLRRRFAEYRSNVATSPMPFSPCNYDFASPLTPFCAQPLKLTMPFLDDTPEAGDVDNVEDEKDVVCSIQSEKEVRKENANYVVLLHKSEEEKDDSKNDSPQILPTECMIASQVVRGPRELRSPSLDFTVDEVRQTSFPSVICLTSSTDDRVVPMHSFKFVAALQALINEMRDENVANRCSKSNHNVLNVKDTGAGDTISAHDYPPLSLRPPQTMPLTTEARFPLALLRVEESVGHGYGKGTGKAINELVDIFSFIGRTIDLEWRDAKKDGLIDPGNEDS